MKHRFILTLLLYAAAQAETFYVSSSGDDCAAGTSPHAAWQTLARVSNGAFDPGDLILLRCGDVWNEQLTVPSSAITFSSCGRGSPPVIDAATLAFGILIRDCAKTTIDGLTVRNAKEVNIEVSGKSDGLTVRRCIVENARLEGIRVVGTDGFVSGMIESNIVQYCGSVGILINERVRDWIVRGNQVVHNGRIFDGDPRQIWTGGIKSWGNNRPGNVSGMIIENNRVVSNGFTGADNCKGIGIWLDEVIPLPGTTNIIRGNLVQGNNSTGIYMEKASHTLTLSNTVIDNARVRYMAGIAVKASETWSANDNRIIGNTVEGPHYWGLFCGVHAVGNECPSVNSNYFAGNMVRGARHELLRLDPGGDNDGHHGTGNRYEK